MRCRLSKWERQERDMRPTPAALRVASDTAAAVPGTGRTRSGNLRAPHAEEDSPRWRAAIEATTESIQSVMCSCKIFRTGWRARLKTNPVVLDNQRDLVCAALQ